MPQVAVVIGSGLAFLTGHAPVLAQPPDSVKMES
jgi:hypothetical protein